MKLTFQSQLIFTTFLLLWLNSVQGQQTITVIGRAYDKEQRDLPLPKLMVINKRTNQGTFADAEGKFKLSLLQTDTLIFSAIGFRVKRISFKDSTFKSQYVIEVGLQKLQYDLKEVSVFAQRSLSDIQKDIDRLGIKQKYTLRDVETYESPITALYARFNKLERSRQQVAEWENEDLKRAILKDLFHLYIKHDIIDLSDEDFDAFIKYLNLSDEFIQQASQFDLVMAIKGKYESFKYRWK